ncbi:MAG: glutathione S-transferase N-terminal domain-containing protein [Anaerolineales bacterium]|nr:glutathione S-transferase N-terminal domain-containing protein [Anaerolineales bacterium]
MNEPVKIIFYATKWCPDCTRARKILDQRAVPYIYVDINQDAAGRAYVQQVNQGNRSVPTIVFPDGSILVEPSNQALEAKLESLGVQAEDHSI